MNTLQPISYEHFRASMSSVATDEYREHHICYNCFRTKSADTTMNNEEDNGIVLREILRDKFNLHVKRGLCHLIDKKVGLVEEVSLFNNSDDITINQQAPIAVHTVQSRQHLEIRTELAPVMLCGCCTTYLTSSKESKMYTKYNICWAGMMWYILSHSRVMRDEKFAKEVWLYMPLTWRQWWKNSLMQLCRHGRNEASRRDTYTSYTYRNVINGESEENKEIVMHDVTNEYYKIQMIKEKKEIKSLFKYWGDHCAVTEVRCPWGCTEMMVDTGMIQYHDFLRHYMDKFIWTHDMDYKTMKNYRIDGKRMMQEAGDLLKGARTDYVGYRGHKGKPIPAANPLLPGMLTNHTIPPTKHKFPLVRPCMIMHKKYGPMILTCKEHDNGMYI